VLFLNLESQNISLNCETCNVKSIILPKKIKHLLSHIRQSQLSIQSHYIFTKSLLKSSPQSISIRSSNSRD
jgi:hypothetical protein